MGWLGATDTAEGFRAQTLRDIGASASRGAAAWFFDMGGYWYDDPELWPVIADSQKIMAWAERLGSPAPAPPIAAFCDERAGWTVSNDQFSQTNSGNYARRSLNLSGVPYDLYYLDDMLNSKLPDYQIYVFLGANTLDKAQCEAIIKRCLRPGKVVIFTGSPGLGSPDSDGISLMNRLTGKHFTYREKGLPVASLPVAGPSPTCQSIINGLVGSFIFLGKSDGTQLVLDPMQLKADDKNVTVFGRFISNTILASTARITTPQGAPSHNQIIMPNGAKIVTMPGGLPPRLIYNLARLAGITTYGTPEQVTAVGCGVAMAHRVRPGPLSIHFGRPVDLLALDGTTVIARGVTEWTPQEPDGTPLKLLNTAVVLYR